MAIRFHPALFDAEKFEAIQKGDFLRRIRFAILPGRHFDGLLDGYDIGSMRVDEETGRAIGSLVDYLFDHLPFEAWDCPDLPGLIGLLGKLTERYGSLVEESGYQYLGYLRADEAAILQSLLAGFPEASEQTRKEILAMREILSIAERYGAGIIFSQS
jgi:hypothetical protein